MEILVVESDPGESGALAAFLKGRGHAPLTADGFASAAKLVKRHAPGLVLFNADGQPSKGLEFLDVVGELDAPPPVIVIAQRATPEDAVRTMKHGAHDFWIKPISRDRLAKTIEWLEAKSADNPAEERGSEPSLIIRNAAMLRVKAVAKKIAASNATVFIQGESGTGKEVFARFIHHNSGRRNKPFVAINCAALPENLLESELFGHEKGAFTGALKAKEGKFELASTGTILLDEVTEIPVHLQAKLLRVLQESEVDRIGGKHPVRVDVRVIATTNLEMDRALQDGRFRKDLYYRLNVIPLKIPPLRERKEDIAPLCSFFIDKYNRLHGCAVEGVDPEADRMLQAYAWPGNVRELENVIQRAVLLTADRFLTPQCLIFDRDEASAPPEELGNVDRLDIMPIAEMEKKLIHKALESVSGNRTRAAEILGISVRTLRNKLNEYRSANGV
jgi:two-component system response regulator FlrC